MNMNRNRSMVGALIKLTCCAISLPGSVSRRHAEVLGTRGGKKRRPVVLLSVPAVSMRIDERVPSSVELAAATGEVAAQRCNRVSRVRVFRYRFLGMGILTEVQL